MIDIRLGDNLDLMKELGNESLDLIYCDILYGTGRTFKDYQDLNPIREEIINHYLPRIHEFCRILNKKGSIFLQMDTRISHWIRQTMDDVFGYNNFQNEIVWCYTTGGKTKKKFSEKHDVILWYSKSPKYKFFPDNILVERKNTKRRMKKILDNGIWYYVAKSKGKEYRYAVDDLVMVDDWWDDISPLHQHHPEREGYDTQKPVELIKRIIEATTNEGDLVGDFYMGSGTTAVACLQTNRKFIGTDINPSAVDISKKRIEKTIAKT